MNNAVAVYQATKLNLTEINQKKFYDQFLFRTVEDLSTQPELIRNAMADADCWIKANMPNCFEVMIMQKPFRMQQFKSVVLAMVMAYQHQEIEKARYKELKDATNSVVTAITDMFSDMMRIMHQDKIPEFGSGYVAPKINTYGISAVHEIKSNLAKLSTYIECREKLNAYEDAQIQSRLELVQELNHLYLANEDLKLNTVSTRRSTGNAKALEHGESKTCGYCLRPIRLKNKESTVVAYHGFTRDDSGYGMILGNSCNGANMQPLEISPEASILFLKHLNNAKQNALNNLDGLEGRILTLEAKQGKATEDFQQLNKWKALLRNSIYLIEKAIPNDQQNMLNKLKQYHPTSVAVAEGIIG